VRAGQEFFNLYNHDFVRVAVAIPAVWTAKKAAVRKPPVIRA